MLFTMFLKGLLIGVIIALPFGPIGVMCMQHSLIRGMTYGLVAGLGAALADALYGALAGFGVSASSEFIEANTLLLEIIGAAFLFFLGLRSIFSKPKDLSEVYQRDSIQKIFAGTFLLTLTNPFTLICFAGIYAGLGICLAGEGPMATLALSAGVFVGSAFWWILISFGMSFLKTKVNLTWIGNINRISGAILLCFALAASFAIVQQILF